VLKILLKYGDEVVAVTETESDCVTIGRRPENDIRIDNLAVSNDHARILVSGGRLYVEDMGSTNGTYVHEKRIDRRWPLNPGDVVHIGKHTLHFDFSADGAAPSVRRDPVVRRETNLDRTLILQTRKQNERRLREAGSAPAFDGPVGVLRVTKGRLARSEYSLPGNLSLIGKDPGADIRLHGFLAPKIAGFVHRDEKGYSLIPPQKKNRLRLNGKPVRRSTPLRPGDVIRIGGVGLSFHLER